MPQFTVVISITNMEAENPLEAARLARQWATEDPMVYDVCNEETGEMYTVDLAEPDEDAVQPFKPE